MATIFSKFWLRLSLFAVLGLSVGCETTDLGSRGIGLGKRGAEGKKEEGVPKEGMLSAKLAALQHAMDELPAEDRRYLNEDYAAYGLLDTDPTHQKILVKLLEGRMPPVVAADALYSRKSNAQWYDGKPALKWTASATKDAANPNRAEVVVGWIHSRLISRITTYVMEYDGEAWSVLEVKLLAEASRELEALPVPAAR